MSKCIFLDRDGVLNVERGDYTYRLQDFVLIEGVPEALHLLKQKGYKIIVITNQAGISKKVYSIGEMQQCHDFLKKEVNHLIDAIYFCPYHPNQTNSLARKPHSLMFEKAIKKFEIDPEQSFMIGDKERDLIPAKKLGIKTILVGAENHSDFADYKAENLSGAVKLICGDNYH